jgi:hypothetical protein
MTKQIILATLIAVMAIAMVTSQIAYSKTIDVKNVGKIVVNATNVKLNAETVKDLILNINVVSGGGTGVTGPPGAQGPPGPAGPQGETGPAGNDGAQGPQGEQGPQGTIGPQGPEGIQGPPGKDGINGTVTICYFLVNQTTGPCPPVPIGENGTNTNNGNTTVPIDNNGTGTGNTTNPLPPVVNNGTGTGNTTIPVNNNGTSVNGTIPINGTNINGTIPIVNGTIPIINGTVPVTDNNGSNPLPTPPDNTTIPSGNTTVVPSPVGNNDTQVNDSQP